MDMLKKRGDRPDFQFDYDKSQDNMGILSVSPL